MHSYKTQSAELLETDRWKDRQTDRHADTKLLKWRITTKNKQNNQAWLQCKIIHY